MEIQIGSGDGMWNQTTEFQIRSRLREKKSPLTTLHLHVYLHPTSSHHHHNHKHHQTTLKVKSYFELILYI